MPASRPSSAEPAAPLRPDGAPSRKPRLWPLALAVAAFIVYGSLIPFEFRPKALDAAWDAFLRIPYLRLGPASRADWVANILLYIPLGFLLTGAFARGARGARLAAAGAAALAASAALAIAIEFAQLFFPPRTVSQNDLIAEAIGAILGIALWWSAGSSIVALLTRFRFGGPYGLRAAAILYALAYLALALFPFDFVVSGAELSRKLGTQGRSAFVLAEACGGSLRCSVKLFAEILLAAPLGLLYGLATRTRGLRSYFGAFAWGAGLGLAIEVAQVFLVSGVSQGVSILARGVGAVWGLAFLRMAGGDFITRHAGALRRIALAAAVPYVLLVLALNGAFTNKWEPQWVALEKLRELRWLPFYYHYFTTETEAMQSLLANAGAYAPVGILFWLLGLGQRGPRGRWPAAAAAAALALAVETMKLFLLGKRPDPTNILIAAGSAHLVLTALEWLARPGVAAAGERVTAAPPSAATHARRGLVLRAATAGVVAAAVIGGVVIATPNRETFVDESTLPKLPRGEYLPPAELPAFRVNHPRLPHPSPGEIELLRARNPDFLRGQRGAANGGLGNLDAAIFSELVDPGSQDLDAIHRRVLELRMAWRGSEQAKTIALAYDWLYARWTEPQRAALRDKLAEACNHLIDFIRNERLSPYNVILYNAPFQALVACAIALHRDDPRGETVMRFTNDLWKNRVLPVWRQVMGRNGGWHEGGEYVGIGIGQAIYQVPAMWRYATGEDVLRSEPGIRGFLDFLVYRTQPDGTHFRWGDGAYFDRHVPDAAPLALEFRHAPAYSLRPPPGLRPSAWPWGPLTDDALVDRSAAGRLPLAKHFDGIGLVVARSDWTPDATYVTFKAGDNFWSHTHLDQGAFTIYKGGPLAIDSGLYGPRYGSDHHMNYAYQTVAHNAITVTDPQDTVPAPGREQPRPIANDGGQRRVGSGWGVEAAPLDLAEWRAKRETYHTGRIVRFADQEGIVVAAADITPAYTNTLSGKGTFSHRTRRVERAWRVFGYDTVDDVVVVYDDVRATRAEFRKRWLLHTVDAPAIGSDRFLVTVPPQSAPGRAGGMLEGRVLLPRQPLLNAIGGKGFEFYVDGVNYDEGGQIAESLRRRGSGVGAPEPGAWRIELSPESDALEDRFLVVMLPSALGARRNDRVKLLENGDEIGCEIAGAKRTTRWWFRPGRLGARVEVVGAEGGTVGRIALH
ncbi:MAG: VanZ family protein [Burkholderiales bacterium]|nr:VanZ family protein [Burkholderiales bacterium]